MSDLTKLEQAVIELVGKILRVDVDGNSSSGNLAEWDSLAQMKIIIQLEKTFSVEIEDENIAGLNSIETIVSYLEEKTI